MGCKKIFSKFVSLAMLVIAHLALFKEVKLQPQSFCKNNNNNNNNNKLK